MRKQIIWVRQATITIYEPKILLGILKTDLLIHSGGLACQQLQIMDNRFASSITAQPHSVGVLCKLKQTNKQTKNRWWCSSQSPFELAATSFIKKEGKKEKKNTFLSIH